MTIVKLYGNLADKYEKEFEFDGVNSITEAISALSANFSDFRQTVLSNKEYNVFIDEYNIGEDELTTNTQDKTIKIMPVLAATGGSVGKIILGTVLVAISFAFPSAFSPALLSAGIGLILSGFAELIFAPPEQNPDDDEKSYLFSGAVNIAQQGVPVPIGYGRIRIGSTNITNSIRGYKSGVS